MQSTPGRASSQNPQVFSPGVEQRQVLNRNGQIETVQPQLELAHDEGASSSVTVHVAHPQSNLVTVHVQSGHQHERDRSDLPDPATDMQRAVHVGGGFNARPDRPPVRLTCGDKAGIALGVATVGSALIGAVMLYVGNHDGDKQLEETGLRTLQATGGVVCLEILGYLGYHCVRG